MHLEFNYIQCGIKKILPEKIYGGSERVYMQAATIIKVYLKWMCMHLAQSGYGAAAIGCVLAIIFNYGCCISFSVSVLFPAMYGIGEHSLPIFLMVMSTTLCIMVKHLDNIQKIKAGKEMPIRRFLAVHVLGRRNA